jgi:heme/copper-type cytochrome/quinol oxidase subunit 4
MYFIIGKERETIATSAIFNRVMIGRILPLFLTPFVIAFLLTLNLANTVAPIIIILLLMTFFDVLAHLKEHGHIKKGRTSSLR